MEIPGKNRSALVDSGVIKGTLMHRAIAIGSACAVLLTVTFTKTLQNNLINLIFLYQIGSLVYETSQPIV